MYTIQIDIRCVNRFCEMVLDDRENAELMIEDLVSCVLVDLLETIFVDEVVITVSSDSRTGLQPCSIQILLQCPEKRFPLLPQARGNLELAVEDAVSCALAELLDIVIVDNVTIGFPLSDAA